jgi:hypothetical protein
MKGQEPKTPEEWQEVVDMAAAARAVADCKMYGLLTGGPDIDVERCDDLLRRGRKRGITPSRPVGELAAAFVRMVNEEERNDGGQAAV